MTGSLCEGSSQLQGRQILSVNPKKITVAFSPLEVTYKWIKSLPPSHNPGWQECLAVKAWHKASSNSHAAILV